MALGPNLRVIVDGDTSRVYRRGDQVKGRVILILENEEQIKGLRLSFVGACTTKTTRPFYVSNNDANACQSRREYKEYIQLFHSERHLVPECTFAANKYSWSFDFTFPARTECQYSRWAHGSKYHKEPHPLPPSFQTYTNSPGGLATVFYYLQAKLTLSGSRGTKKVTQMLGYLPSPRDTALEPKITSRVLYAQTWKPAKDSKTAIDKIFTKASRKSLGSMNIPRIVPALHFPEKVAPGQQIPLLLSLSRASNGEHPECVLDSLNVSISTYTTLICGQPMTQPEDEVSKHVTCISKHDLNTALSFSTPNPLTTNLRLVDDAECVPTFKTYTITRRYTLSIVVGIKAQDEKFTIRSITPLEILPRIPPSEPTGAINGEDEEIDPLPLYMPREPSKEFAPDYDSLYSLSPTPSTSRSLALEGTRSSSFNSGVSTPSTAPSTPESELNQPEFETTMIRSTQMSWQERVI